MRLITLPLVANCEPLGCSGLCWGEENNRLLIYFQTYINLNTISTNFNHKRLQEGTCACGYIPLIDHWKIDTRSSRTAVRVRTFVSFGGAPLPPVLASCLTQSILCGVTQLHTWKGRVATETCHITDHTHQSRHLTILTEVCRTFDHTHTSTLLTHPLNITLLTTPTNHDTWPYWLKHVTSLTTPTNHMTSDHID